VAAVPISANFAEVQRQERGTILSADRLSVDRGWVLTDRALLMTDDAGASWLDRTAGRGLEGVSDVFFLSASETWLAGVSTASPRKLVVLRTTDGGRSWDERAVDVSSLPAGQGYVRARIRFVDRDHGWLLGQVATSSAFSVAELLRTDDGGMSWQRLPRPPAAGRFVFVDAEIGFMAGAPVSGRLYRSHDGGRSWHEVGLKFPAEAGTALYDLPAFTRPLQGSLAVTLRGDAPRVLTFVTRDGGVMWSPADSLALPAGDYDEPVPIALDPDGRVTAVATPGVVMFAKDGVRRSRPLTPKGVGKTAPLESAAVAVRSLSLAEDGTAWMLVAEGGCDGAVCRQVTRLVAVDVSDPGGGGEEDLLVRFEERPRPPKKLGVLSKAGVISLAHGFDKCEAGTEAQMQTWWEHSPHEIANIYFGGSARACSQPNLDAGWVATVFDQGWRLIPTWVGPQAPCTRFIRRFGADPAEARSDGLAEADAAAAAAAVLGLGAGAPLYYDVEYYDETDAACGEAVGAFIDAWSERVTANGYLAGAYGNARNITNDWLPGTIANPPDAVWLVPWVCGRTSSCDWTPTVFSVPGLDDAYWANYRRIRQYWGPHTETWGGVTFEIDGDYANGPVAAPAAPPWCWRIVPPHRWQGEYFANTDLDGDPAMVRDDGGGELEFDWGSGSPGGGCGVPADLFSVRWTRTVQFEAGTYRFTVTADDGVRLFIDGALEIDQWRSQAPAAFNATVTLAAGEHTIRLEHFEDRGGAAAALSWKRLSRARRAGGRRIPSS
jgi:photosystem II stability/assembly factor-like uncharacterized protein